MDWRTHPARLLVPGLMLALAGGCIEREGRPVNPCTQVTVSQRIQVTNVDKVDLLFMVDNSNSMGEEQASLAQELPRMVEILTSGDFELDGVFDGPNDFEPVRDLNVGVITSDMGVGGHYVSSCENADFGDDGRLRTQGRTDIAGCDAMYPRFMNYQPGSQTPASFADDVACVARAGLGGCGFEQQLEAILKAITPTTAQSWTSPDFVPIGTPNAPHGLDKPFFRMTSPHGDGHNDGFLREEAVLAIIPVTDEEDCSAANPDLSNPGDPQYSGKDLNLRCFAFPDALHPVSRYVHGFIQTRSRPSLLVYAPIVGIPPDLAPGPDERPDYEKLISPDMSRRDPRMWEREDPTDPTRLVPSCNVPDRGIAFPPVRIVQVAEGLQNLGAGVTVQSICQASFENALTEVIRQIKSALGNACLPRPLNVRADGSVSCDVVAKIPMGQTCEQIGATPKRDENDEPVIEDGRAICVLTPLVPTEEERMNRVPPDGTGWFYDNYTAEGADNCQVGTEPYQRIAFAGTPPPSGAEVRLECFLAVQRGSGSGNVDIGTFCDPESDSPEENPCSSGQTPEGAQLSCDPVQRVCGVSCETDVDCRAAGLVGYVCDTRPISEVDPDFNGPGASSEPYNYCVNPTCS